MERSIVVRVKILFRDTGCLGISYDLLSCLVSTGGQYLSETKYGRFPLTARV